MQDPTIHPWQVAHRFLDSAFGFARNDSFFAVPSVRPDQKSGTTFHAVIPTERAEQTSGGIYEMDI